MNLSDALRQIAEAGGLDADALISFAAEDTLPGRGEYSAMSVFADEAKILYALVRALRPSVMVEVGTNSGCSTAHILAALEANGNGKLYSVDIDPGAGSGIPDELRGRLTLVTGDVHQVELPKRADMVFEDSDHSYEGTRACIEKMKALNPRLILCHDYFMHRTYTDGFDVERAFVDALGDAAFGVEVDGAFPGIGVWFNPSKK